MLEGLSASGWKHYSLFVEEESGLVVGYFESEDVEKAIKTMSETDIDARWQKEMAKYFSGPTSGDAKFLQQYFYLP